MKIYTEYNPQSGEITRILKVRTEQDLYREEGMEYIEGYFSDALYQVEDGVAVLKEH